MQLEPVVPASRFYYVRHASLVTGYANFYLNCTCNRRCGWHTCACTRERGQRSAGGKKRLCRATRELGEIRFELCVTLHTRYPRPAEDISIRPARCGTQWTSRRKKRHPITTRLSQTSVVIAIRVIRARTPLRQVSPLRSSREWKNEICSELREYKIRLTEVQRKQCLMRAFHPIDFGLSFLITLLITRASR